MHATDRENMEINYVVDTGALIFWPVERLTGAVASPKQQKEIYNLHPDRAIIIDALEIIWKNPSDKSIDKIIEIGKVTGDLSGLSSTDIDILALAYEEDAKLITDDYRMQNLAKYMKIDWESVSTEGIKEVWIWEIVCRGCKKVQEIPNLPYKNKKDSQVCSDCGSDVKLRKKK